MVCGSYCLEQRTNIPILSENYRKRNKHPDDTKIKNELKVLKGRGERSGFAAYNVACHVYFHQKFPHKKLKK